MQPALPAPVLSYLRILEIQLKHRFGVRVEEVLSDAREFLVNDYKALHQSEPGIDDESCYQHFLHSFGEPNSVAEGYGLAKSPKGLQGYAPGWRICCTRCGISAPASETGMIRVAAYASHKYIGSWCSQCGMRRWFRVIKDLDETNLTDQLAMNVTPEEMRARMHKPLETLFAIFGIIVAVLLTVLAITEAIFFWR